jgi:hypothetical protein
MTYGDVVNAQTCVTYVRDDFNLSSDANVNSVLNVYGNCSSCNILPTPTPTSTQTQTPTPTNTPTTTQTPTNTPTTTQTPTPTRTPGGTPPVTPTPTSTTTPTNTQTPTNTRTQTPTPSPTSKYVYVYESCVVIDPKISSQLTQIIQTLPVSFTINVGQVFKDKDGICWRYVGRFDTNYIPPANVYYSTQSDNYFVGALECLFVNCTTCNSVNLKPLATQIQFPQANNINSPTYLPATQTSIPVTTIVDPPNVPNCSSLLFGLTVRRIYYSTVNNPPLLSDNYFELPLVYGQNTTYVTGLTPGTGYYFSLFCENDYGSSALSFPFKVYTLN